MGVQEGNQGCAAMTPGYRDTDSTSCIVLLNPLFCCIRVQRPTPPPHCTAHRTACTTTLCCPPYRPNLYCLKEQAVPRTLYSSGLSDADVWPYQYTSGMSSPAAPSSMSSCCSMGTAAMQPGVVMEPWPVAGDRSQVIEFKTTGASVD